MNITETSKALFLAYARDAGNWNGQPLVGGNVGGNIKAQRGNLTQLKQAGLITTQVEREPGSPAATFINFTDAGKAFAAENGITI